VNDWFDSAKYLFEEKTDELNLKLELELPDSDPAREAAGIENCVEIIRWYQNFISAKLARAVRGSLEDDEASGGDSCGSAKIALIAMDRSLGAWGQMSEHFPQYKDNILDILGTTFWISSFTSIDCEGRQMKFFLTPEHSSGRDSTCSSRLRIITGQRSSPIHTKAFRSPDIYRYHGE